MKKIITLSLATLFILSLNFQLFAQCPTCDNKDYANKKAQFWNEYQTYKKNIDHNNVANKPVDPNGLFMVDENNNFAVKNPINPVSNQLLSGPPWRSGYSDAVSTGYFFSQTTTTYASINTTGTLLNSACDDSYNSSIPIGFSFTYNGTAYTTVSSSCNGWIMMGAGTPSGYSPICTGSYANVIAPFARDLYGNASGNGLYYQTTGSAPNRVFTIEWYHWGIYSSGLNELDFEIKLYESTNIIQCVYKPETPTTTVTDVQVGLMGATNTDFLTRTGTTAWTTTSSGTNCSYVTFSPTYYPSAGLTYSWLPVPATYPQYYNYNIAGSGNSFPFAVAAGKEVQWLIKAGELNQPSAAPSGGITALSFYMAAAGTSTYTTFTIKLAQDTITTLPTGVIYTGPLQTVYSTPSLALTSAASTWMTVPIIPFVYNPNLSLIVDVSQCLSTTATMTINQQTLTGFRRTYINETSCVPTYGGQDATIAELGVNIVSMALPGPMGYVSSNTIQSQPGAPFAQSSINNQVVQVQVVDTGSLSPLIINRLKFETTGSNLPATDIANAKLYYTRSVNTFATTRQYGSTVTSPSGVFNFSDTATLDPNATNYFWLTYDIASGANLFDSVDAQCDSIIGSSPMGGVVPTTVAPAGNNPIDNYCRGQFTTLPCPYDLYINNVTLGSINNTTGCIGTLPYVYNNYTGLSTVVRQNNTYVMLTSNVLVGNTNACNFGTWVDWNNNNSFADAGEFVLSSTIPSNSPNPAVSTLVVPSGATVANHRMRIRSNFASYALTSTYYCTTMTYGEQEDYTLIVRADTNMYYQSSTTTQTNVSPVYTPSANTQIIGIQVVTDGTISPLSATSFTLNTAGTSHPLQDITTAKVYWTGTNPTFGILYPVGSSVGPNGSFTITGSQPLAQGINYFWLTYDVPSTAPNGDTLDAQCSSITVGGVARTPTITSPAGFRIITGSAICGNYTIPGSYPSIAAAITDLNAKGSPICPTVYNVAAGWVETAANLTITSTGTAANPITFRKSGTGANPLINAGIGTGTYDGVINFYGVSYITFDGIDIKDTINTTTTTQMERGYALLRPDATHGDQYITIKNCNISLNKTNTSTWGIYSYNQNLAGTTTAPTSPSGTSSNNSFLSNNISNCNGGMYIYGYADTYQPFSLEDHDNTVSTTGTGRSSITNFGGSSSNGYGIYAYYQSNPIISNTYINSRGGVNSTGYLYGIYNYAYYSANNSTITGDTVTLVDTTGSTGVQYCIYNATYYGKDVNISNNVVRDCVNPCASYYSYYIYNATGSMAYTNSITMTGNKVIGNRFGVAASTTTYTYNLYNAGSCASSINISNNLDSGNVVYGTTAYTNYLMYSSGAAMTCKMNNNRILNDTLCGPTSTGSTYGVYSSTGGYNSTMVDSNVVMNNVSPSTSSHYFYILYCSSPANAVDFSYNTVSNNISSGTGYFYSMYYSGTPYYGSTVNINYNNVTNQQKITATGTGGIYGIYHSGAGMGVININNNTVSGWSSAAATVMYGIYQSASPPNNVNINNNKVGNFTNGGVSTIYGIYNYTSNATATVNISQDSVYNITSPGSTIYGIYNYSGLYVNIFKNRVLGLTSNTATSATVYGLYVGAGTNNYIYDNFVSDLNAPASINYSPPTLDGIYIGGGTNNYAYYNTVYLKTTSSGSTFGTACLYANTAYNLDLRNNVLVNLTTPGASGGWAVAYQRSSNALATYLNSSNNNCFYAGTPGLYNLLYYDGTNSIQTMAALRTLVIPRDNNSMTENPPFVNGTTAPYDLRISTTTATQLESGGQIISTVFIPPAPINITTDAFSTPRYPNSGYPVGTYTPVAPDVGAHEFGGVNADLTPPFISYTALGTGGTANRSFQNVIITDQSGVNVTASYKPRCYYKRSTDGNVINDNTNTTDGWKYVQSNGTTSPFDFTIDYTKLNGGTGVISGQVVQYFVIAQDLATTPNVGANQATFTTAPTSVSLLAANAPITNTLSYTINTNSFSGTYQVGTAQTYTSLTGASGIFAAINAGTVSGNVTIQITSNTVEDGTNGLNLTNESGAGGYWIRIVPFSATMYVLSGTSANASGLIRLNGAKRVVIDGQNGLGSGKYFTFSNLNGASPTIGLVSDAIRDSIKYCYIESNNTGTTSGTVLFGAGVTWGNDSNTIAYCDIKDTSGYSTPANAIISNGTTTNYQIYNNYNTITNCNIYNWFYDGGAYTAAIYLNTGSSDWTITNNSIYQTASRTVANASTFVGIFSNTTTQNDIIVTNNYIGGTAPSCGGTPMTYSGAGLYNFYGMYLYVGGLAPSSVQGNVIQNMNLTTSPASSSSTFFRAIWAGYVYSWVNIGNISGNTIGAATGNGSITLTTNTTTTAYTIYMIYHAGFGAIMNNTIGSITLAGNSTGTTDGIIGIYLYNTSIYGQTFSISNNLIGSLTTPNSISLTNTSDLGQQCHGIIASTYYGTVVNITNNIVANITSYNNASAYVSYIYGIRYSYYSSVDVTVNITGNTVRNLTVNTNYALAGNVLMGILGYNYYGTCTISQNTIYSLYSNGTTGATQTTGIANRLYVTNGTISRNKIYDFRMLGTGTIAPNPNLIGISLPDYGVYPVLNNMVSLTNGDVTGDLMMGFNRSGQEKFEQVVVKNPPINKDAIPKNIPKNVSDAISNDKKNNTLDKKISDAMDLDVENSKTIQSNRNNGINANNKKIGDEVNSTINCGIVGIWNSGVSYSSPSTIYYNTIYVGGSQPTTSTCNSYGFLRTTNTTYPTYFTLSILRNNFFINARTGGTNYCISNESSLIEGWPTTASNYNVFLGSSDATIGEWGTGNALTLAGWVAATGGDNQSWSTNTGIINPANLLTSISTGDLSINTNNASAWILSGKGMPIAGMNTDYTGNSRSTSISTGVTDIGAFEFAATPPNNPVATQLGTPGAGGTTSYVLYGRTICSINWGLGGTSYPTSMNVNYYSGINPLSNSSLGPNYSNSYWTVVPVGSLTGARYDITVYFGDNETYTINTPSTNTILANYNGTFWQAFPSGLGSMQTSLIWSSVFSVLAPGLNNLAFSTYALADGSIVPQLISPANLAVFQPATDTLVWSAVTGATSYRVQLASDSLFSAIVVDDSSMTGTNRIVTGLLTQSYFWRVKAKFSAYSGPYTAPYKFSVGNANALVNLKVIPGGFYNTSMSQLNMKDTIRIILVDSSSCAKVDSARVLIDSVTFSATPIPSFARANTGKYYILVYHRNHLPIASRYTQQVTRGSTVSYDFTTDSSKTYGFNVIKVSTSPVLWGMIPGDANQDEYVDALDQLIWIAQNGQNGFYSADFNGDTYVDALDQFLWILYNGNSSYLPCGFIPSNNPVMQKKNIENSNYWMKVIQQNQIKQNNSNNK